MKLSTKGRYAMVALTDIALQPAVTPYASPLKMFEYMALNLAIIAPNQPNITEIISHDETGLLFNNDAEFDDALRRLCTNGALRYAIGQSGHDRLQEAGFTWASNATRDTICKGP